MKKRKSDILFYLFGWILLAVGMGVFLFFAETTIIVRIFTVGCCVIAGILFEVGRRCKKQRTDEMRE